MAQHPEMISSRGSTAGQLKSEFQRVVKAAEKFNSQEFFRDIIEKCEKQVILTGEICGVPVKCCLDLFDRETNSIYDIKCMKDFNEQWSKEEKKYIPWYYAWGYVLQLAVYREIVKQNFGKEPKEIFRQFYKAGVGAPDEPPQHIPGGKVPVIVLIFKAVQQAKALCHIAKAGEAEPALRQKRQHTYPAACKGHVIMLKPGGHDLSEAGG